jgi:acetoin utilization protein AcuB
MIVRNWMSKDPLTTGSDTLVSDVKRLLTENNLRAVPVVDDGRLRGLITRAACLRAAASVTRSQDPHELAYFAKRLKAKDLMVRRPATVDAGDTMEHCLLRGQEDGISQFPVLDDGQVVGMVSASEIFHLAARILGAWENWAGITLAPTKIEKATLRSVAEAVEGTGAVVKSIFSVGDGAKSGNAPRKIIVRFEGAPLDNVVTALQDAGFDMLEACDEVQRCRNGSQ